MRRIRNLLLLLMALLWLETALAVPIGITWVSDLDFGWGVAGDPAKVVPPGTTENSVNASFSVTGDPNRAFTITLPTSINMTTGGGGTASRRIRVDTFVSNPAAGANGLLDGTGQQMLFVGARRAALRANQVVGSYAGTFTVTVVY